jgi:hypothetical protein
MFVNFFPRSFSFRERTRVSPPPRSQSAVTVELDFIDPITGPRGIDKLCFHRFHKVRQRCRRQFHTEPRNADASTEFGRSNLSGSCLLWRWHFGIRWLTANCACMAANGYTRFSNINSARFNEMHRRNQGAAQQRPRYGWRPTLWMAVPLIKDLARFDAKVGQSSLSSLQNYYQVSLEEKSGF